MPVPQPAEMAAEKLLAVMIQVMCTATWQVGTAAALNAFVCLLQVTVGDQTAVVRDTGMSEKMQQGAVECAIQSLGECSA